MTADGIATSTVASISAGGYAPDSVATRSGEHRLMLAILEDAVSLHVKSWSVGFVTRRDIREAREWLASGDRSLPFSFESICDVLGLDPSYIRRGIRAFRARPTETAARFAVRHHGSGRRPSIGPPPDGVAGAAAGPGERRIAESGHGRAGVAVVRRAAGVRSESTWRRDVRPTPSWIPSSWG